MPATKKAPPSPKAPMPAPEQLAVHGGGVLADHLAPCDCAPVATDASALIAAGGAPAKFSDNGGKVLQVVQVQLIYWGSAWTSTTPSPSPSSAAITAAVQTMMHSAYLTGLDEYRGIGRGFVRGAAVIPREGKI